MIRPLTCVTLLMAACSGLYLYQTKARTLGVDHDIARTLKQADATWQRASVLRAEYALLNDPTRLAGLATQNLPALQTTAPGQFSTWADLDHRLPPVGPPPTPPDATPDATAPMAALPNGDAPDEAHAEPTPPPEPARPAPPPKPAVVAALPRPTPLAPPRPTPVSRPAPTPLPVTQVAVIHPEPVPTAPAVIRSPAPVSSPFVGSALGMARTLRPPGSDGSNSLR